jgi:acyl-coenzyme A thioesterase PaaI-like protein
VLRRGKRLAFVAAELRDRDRLVATAQVTKSVVSGLQ